MLKHPWSKEADWDHIKTNQTIEIIPEWRHSNR